MSAKSYTLRRAALLLTGLVFAAAQDQHDEKQAPRTQEAGNHGAVQIQMRNVNFRLASRHVRLFPARVSEATGSRLFQEHGRQRLSGTYARLFAFQ